MIILGICVGHDSAACLVIDGAIVANIAEERFSRIKHDAGFPAAAIDYCLQHGGISSSDIDVVAFAATHLPLTTESRFALGPEQLRTLAGYRAAGAHAAHQRMLERYLPPLYTPRIRLSPNCRLLFVEHHLSHAAAAHFTRGRDDRCLIMTLDGIGDQVSTAIWIGDGNDITPLQKWGQDASLGWFYGSVTEALGWQHGDGEGTTMGLAAYGDPAKVGDGLTRFHPAFSKGQLVQPHPFGIASTLNKNG